jgi:3-oxoacyl-[acyl-carrier protein] reductase
MRNVLVTGGSRGLGLGICRALQTAGFRVIAVARSMNPHLAAAMLEAESVTHGSFQFVPCDLAETEHLLAKVKSIRKSFGPVFGLVNNAGISIDGAFPLMKSTDIERVIRLNTLSPILLTKHVVRNMMADGGGRIVNISSVTAFTGYSGLAVYGATKASLIGFTRSLAREVGRMGVTVNAVAPGFVDTDLTGALTEQQREAIIRRSALKRLVEIEDVANSVAFLLSDKARNITGTVLTVDAGSTA